MATGAAAALVEVVATGAAWAAAALGAAVAVFTAAAWAAAVSTVAALTVAVSEEAVSMAAASLADSMVAVVSMEVDFAAVDSVDFMIAASGDVSPSASTRMTTMYDYPYGYYPYDSSDLYADNGNCYVVQRRVHTKHGWRLQPRQVCG